MVEMWQWKFPEFRGYPDKVYNKSWRDNEKKQNFICMKGPDMIVSMLYIKIYILTYSTY